MESGRVVALSIHQPLSISIASLFIPSPPLPFHATFALSLSLYRMIRAEKSSASNSRRSARIGPSASITPRSTRASSVALMLHRDAPLHSRVRTSIRSCFSTSSFLHKFSVSLRLDFLSSPLCSVDYWSRRRKCGVSVFVCIRRRAARCVSRDGIALMEVRCRCPVKFYNYKTVPHLFSLGLSFSRSFRFQHRLPAPLSLPFSPFNLTAKN